MTFRLIVARLGAFHLLSYSTATWDLERHARGGYGGATKLKIGLMYMTIRGQLPGVEVLLSMVFHFKDVCWVSL